MSCALLGHKVNFAKNGTYRIKENNGTTNFACYFMKLILPKATPAKKKKKKTLARWTGPVPGSLMIELHNSILCFDWIGSCSNRKNFHTEGINAILLANDWLLLIIDDCYWLLWRKRNDFSPNRKMSLLWHRVKHSFVEKKQSQGSSHV